jgi:hypothetical protein
MSKPGIRLPQGELVKLTLTHEGFADESVVVDGISKGWPAILSSLKSLLETGEALVIKMAPPQRMLEALKKLGIATP